MSLKIYVDTSFRFKDNMSQAGYVYTDPTSRKMYMKSSVPFYADNNNDAEIMGVFYAIQDVRKQHKGIGNGFIVYNDNVIACTMLNTTKELSKSVIKKHKEIKVIKDYCKKHNIKIKMVQVSRRNSTIKLCDRLSKKFRKGGWDGYC